MADESGPVLSRRHLVAGARGNVVVHFGSDPSRQLATGRHNALVDVPGAPGAVVNVLPTPPPGPRMRPGPVRLVPRDFLAPLGRAAEIAEATAALAAGTSVGFHAGPGWGRSTLLRHLANHPPAGVGAGGVVHLSGRDRSAGDLLQALFEALFETGAAFRPGPGQLRACLAEVEILLVVDDLRVGRGALSGLLSAAPRCLLMAASGERALGDEGESIELGGLPEAAALTLMERALGRPLAAVERASARQLCAALGGCPIEVLRAGALLREGRWPPAEAFGEPGRAGGVIGPILMEHASPAEDAVLGALTALGGAATAISHVAAIAGLAEQDALDALISLAGMYLVEERPDGRWAAAGVEEDLEEPAAPSRWAGAAVDHFARWAAAQEHPERLLGEVDALVQAVRLAHRLGVWPRLVGLARTVSRALLLAGRWGAWGAVLERGLDAARSAGDPAATAWFQHQLGTRALALGQADEAASRLRTALRIRRSLRDRAGAATTRHNLSLLRLPARRRWRRRPAAGAVAAAVLLAGAGAAVVALPTLRPAGHVRALPGRLDFGSVALTGAGTVPITISNDGNGPLPITRISAGGEFQLTSDCPASLPPHARCTVEVTFRPSSAAAVDGDLTVSLGSGARATIALSGTGVPPRLQPSPAQLDFGQQALGSAGAPQTVQLANTDTVAAAVAVGVEGDFAASGGCVGTQVQLQPGQACAIAVTFAPTAHGRRDGRLVFREPGAEGSIPLTGEGVAAAPHLAAAALDLGAQTVGQPGRTATILLTDDGDGPFTATRVAATGDFTATGCLRVTLAPGASCPVRVTFTPHAAGVRTGTLTVQGGGVTLQAALRGVGAAPPPSPALAPTSLDLGALTVGQSGTGSVVLSNSGAGAFPVTAISASGDFTAGACPGPLASGSSCTISVTFTPRAAGARTGTLTVQGGGVTLQASLTGSGVAPITPTPSPGPSPTP